MLENVKALRLEDGLKSRAASLMQKLLASDTAHSELFDKECLRFKPCCGTLDHRLDTFSNVRGEVQDIARAREVAGSMQIGSVKGRG